MHWNLQPIFGQTLQALHGFLLHHWLFRANVLNHHWGKAQKALRAHKKKKKSDLECSFFSLLPYLHSCNAAEKADRSQGERCEAMPGDSRVSRCHFPSLSQQQGTL